MSKLDQRLEPPAKVRRFEVILGALRRLGRSADDRARLREETLAPDIAVSAAARRHGMTPQPLFIWGRNARKWRQADARPAFVPTVIAPNSTTEPEPVTRLRARRGQTRRRGAAVGALKAES